MNMQLDLQQNVPMDMRGQLASGRRAGYILAGHATFTIRNPQTGTRFTYTVKKPDVRPFYFVGLLSGPDNTADYEYLGVVDHGVFRLTAKSHVSATAPSAQAFEWLSRHWEDDRVEVWHEGRCGRCGRRLTVPESIESGIGPVCERL